MSLSIWAPKLSIYCSVGYHSVSVSLMKHTYSTTVPHHGPGWTTDVRTWARTASLLWEWPGPTAGWCHRCCMSMSVDWLVCAWGGVGWGHLLHLAWTIHNKKWETPKTKKRQPSVLKLRVHGQAGHFLSVLRQQLVARHAHCVNDVDDGVLGAHPNVVVDQAQHAVLHRRWDTLASGFLGESKDSHLDIITLFHCVSKLLLALMFMW